MEIKKTAVEIHNNNINKGFTEGKGERNVGEMLMLITSELGEALEADRKSRWFKNGVITKDDAVFAHHVKDTVEDEIADAVIRLFDFSEEYGFDLEWHVRQKMDYNSKREYKHGKKY